MKRAFAVVRGTILALGASAALFACVSFAAEPDVADPSLDGGADASSDATGSAADDGDAGGSGRDARFCATRDAAFCDDFDDVEAGAFPPGWFPTVGGTCQAALTQGGASAPNALGLVGTARDYGVVYVELAASAPPAAEFEFAVALGANAPLLVYAQFDWHESATRRHGVRLSISRSGGQLEEFDGVPLNEPTVGTADVAAFAWTGWHTVRVYIDWTKAMATVFVDGNVKGTSTLARAFNGGTCYLELGVWQFGEDDAGQRATAFDNVVITPR